MPEASAPSTSSASPVPAAPSTSPVPAAPAASPASAVPAAPAASAAPIAPFLRRLLELVAEDAPAEEYGAVTVRARAAGAGPADLAELEQAVGTALRVRRVLRQHRRRESELAALFDTAGDLAALRDLDAVLQSIVRRARMLLGTDTAYLTLRDEEAGDTYMRVTDGSVSPLFQTLRLSYGDGLGGLVAQSARPYATPDYRTDQRFRHTGSIDEGVLDEGLVGILGVPLLLGGRGGAARAVGLPANGRAPNGRAANGPASAGPATTGPATNGPAANGSRATSSGAADGDVIGVLFAADRTPRPFTPDEVALLCSLAAHAAIAIDTAKSITELAEAGAVIREHAAAMQRAEEAHDRLTDLVLRGGDVSEVAAAVAGLLEGPITIHDSEGRTLAAVGRRGEEFDGPVPEASSLVRHAADSHAAARAVFRDSRWTCAVLAGQELLGSLVLYGRGRLDDSDRRLFERAGVVTALLLLLSRSVAETENRVRGELVADLLTAPDRDPAGLVVRGLRLGIDLARPCLLLVAETVPGHHDKLVAAAGRCLFGSDGISAEQSGTVVLLLPHDGALPGAAARAAVAQLTPLVGVPVTVAAGGPAAGPRAIADAHAEALRCLRALQALGRTGDGASAAELGFLGVLLGNERDVESFVTATLGPLLEYDARRGTELVRTLGAYFACGGTLTRTKDELHLHVNTVVQRLDRIQALLGAGWSDPERALELQLALRLHLLSGS
ncbi:helix-turn-helix domain-containing protein [Actinacidiphila acididurans]|uniref:Helix-turn-helix domain-containing protein n=1 Tax=Actinacidiphila acididurans TaxID=2784346 RepID=A0ABS2TJ93_9ACTN|nr:GAF domain-containing protein [Actinacidiphila acididurans]MBM9503418.1 helix-turn-helix domain-containing protein [Actinacidiphila acididurans]